VKYQQRATPVPTQKTRRVGGLAALATQLAANVIKDTSKTLLQGQKPSLAAALANPNNALAIAKKLAHMRGAAMKLGQLLSMDAGELLPPTWEPVLQILRQQSHWMPQEQLVQTLKTHWGDDWFDEFKTFPLQPIAAASIGQVHRATRWDGREVAVKIQYPGVKQSIDSDIDSAAWLLKTSRLLPAHMDLAPLLAKAKAQLHEEADYEREAEHLQKYAQLVASEQHFHCPTVHEDLSNASILCMDYVVGVPIESLSAQADIDWVCNALLQLTLQELFSFRLMQSDPNFANFLVDLEARHIHLLDFGATRTITPEVSEHFWALAQTMQSGERASIEQHLMALGLVDEHMPRAIIEIINDACVLAGEAIHTDDYDIKEQGLVSRLLQLTEPLVASKTATATPDFDVALINRKVTGVILLANRLGARLNIHSMLSRFSQPSKA
jgi:predicted unusual protein kinase regulating ubiquinone biosynthesis (AarF/ABC1/UbiB family)